MVVLFSKEIDILWILSRVKTGYHKYTRKMSVCLRKSFAPGNGWCTLRILLRTPPFFILIVAVQVINIVVVVVVVCLCQCHYIRNFV